jgi:hypothetical protein
MRHANTNTFVGDDAQGLALPLVEQLPGVRKTDWSYDNTGTLQAVSLKWTDGRTVTVTDPAALTAFAFGGVREIVRSYDDDNIGMPESVAVTSVDGETVTMTDPAAIAALTPR